MEDHHTHYLGRVADGRLFWGYETFTFDVPVAERRGSDWVKTRREYAVLHVFDDQGKYLSTRWHRADSSGNDFEELIEGWIEELGAFEYCDIAVGLFQTTIDGRVFGLVADAKTGLINLQPSSTISFQEPWDGEYYT